jgi:tripartite-type tricarboxylate transporter receptor subunit TctC
VRSGQLKAYTVLQPKRWWAAPEVPTLDELGIPEALAAKQKAELARWSPIIKEAGIRAE